MNKYYLFIIFPENRGRLFISIKYSLKRIQWIRNVATCHKGCTFIKFQLNEQMGLVFW